MANLKAIYMTEVQYYDGSQWQNLKVKDRSSAAILPANTGHIILYSTASPSPGPSSMVVNVDFDHLKMRESAHPESDYTAFHTDGISSSQISPLIRYKIAVGTFTSEEVITINQTYHYMMIKAGFPSDAYAGAGSTSSTSSSSGSVSLKFYFPAFLASHATAQAVTHLTNLLQTVTNWTVTKNGPSPDQQTINPSSVTVGTPTATDAGSYGLAKVLVTLACGLNFPTSGTYTLVATFTSNDADFPFLLPGEHSITATIQVNSGSTTPLIVSFDTDAAMSVNIA